jgi:hypothetical protein
LKCSTIWRCCSSLISPAAWIFSMSEYFITCACHSSGPISNYGASVTDPQPEALIEKTVPGIVSGDEGGARRATKSETATNSMANATHFELAPEQLVGVQGLATLAGASSLVPIRTSQHKGHPHPVLSRSTSETLVRAFSPWSFLPTELEARLHPVMS